MADSPPFLRTPPVHIDFLRTLDEVAASLSQQRTEELADKPSISLRYNDELRAWYWAHPSGGRQAG
jgi:hypothetical protein